MSKYIYLPYREAKELLQEGDVLLFRSTGFLSALIKVAGESEYSHVAIASKHNNYFEAVEFREWFGSRTINLENYVNLCKKDKTEIDVFRPIPQFTNIKFDLNLRESREETYPFDGKILTDCMRALTGFPYSYKRILIILKIKLFRLHLFRNIEKITKDLPTDEIVMPVCSNVVSHCFNKNHWQLTKRKNDEYVEPGDLARSARLNYLFTLST